MAQGRLKLTLPAEHFSDIKMKFQKTNQNKENSKNKAISETSALPLLSPDNLDSENASAILSSAPDSIDLKSLRALVEQAANQDNWSDVEKKEIDDQFSAVEKSLDSGDLKSAEIPLLKVLKAIASFNSDCHQLTWEICEILAKIFARQGNHEKCLAMLNQSLNIKQAVLGEADPTFLLTLVESANCLKSLGKEAEAEELYKQAREIKAEQKKPS